MADYEITEVDRQDDWENNYGKYASFLVRFQGQDQQVQINRKFKGEDVKAPAVGDTLTGSIEVQANGVPKFKQDYSGGSFSGSSGSKSDKPSDEYWRGLNMRISRQHSQEMALRYAAIKGKTDVTFDEIKQLADAFDNDLPELPSA